MAPKPDEVDSEWEEVEKINSYALFMAYLSMAVKGMGFLVFTWTTVVLLGGFVSMLKKKDFWSLTIITLVQTTGVFDVFLNEKLRYVGKSFLGLVGTVVAMLFPEDSDYLNDVRELLVYALLVLLLLVFAAILCPLAALYLFGLLITTALSLWRLIQRDYGMSDGDANLEPALNVLYSLALFQGVLFLYRFVSRFAGKRLAGVVAENYGFGKEDEGGRESVMEYMRKTRVGCEKDPSFAKGRNLVRFAVEQMKPDAISSVDYVSGARILDKLLEQKQLQDQHTMIRQLVGSASSSQVMQRLLHSLRSTSPRDTDARQLAARIVAHLADEISLTSFPHGIGCISSLLETTTSEQQDDDSAPSAHCKALMKQGLIILDKLATEEPNRRIISTEQGLLSKAMAPVRADLLHRIDHGAWSDIVAASLQLMCRLVTAPGNTGAKLRSQVFKNKGAINPMEKILKCDRCNEKLHILAIKILTQLPMEEPATASLDAESRDKVTGLLVDIFTNENNKDASKRQLAGEALAMLSDQSESSAAVIFKARDSVVHDLCKMLLDDKTDREYRISAAEILEHLYNRYKKNDGYLKKLTEAMNDVLPTVLKEILLFPPKQEEKKTEKAEKETDGAKFPATNPDPERGPDPVASHDNGNVNEQKDDTNRKNVDRKLHAALLSLSAAVFEKSITDDKALAQLADKIVPGDSAFSFPRELKKMVEGNSDATANCLRIMKITSRMIISLINLNGGYVQAELESLLESLSKASDNMLELEGFMMFSSSDHSTTTKPFTSFVKEAQDLLEEKKKQPQNLATTPAPRAEIS
ncbi:hypothetical protein E2562_022844 [Oryza meyeriana var. granulata]|uniref:Uncharacterized protein n=1 Tax=Oryza meyeriana var. granulata TaxID=110450 RepID=A0A6G1BNF2_9ORYZ|nr:hypothetical protein E2562_022844 [Oryza meyeriana var. granulata]